MAGGVAADEKISAPWQPFVYLVILFHIFFALDINFHLKSAYFGPIHEQ